MEINILIKGISLILFIIVLGLIIWMYHNVLTRCFFKHSYIKLLSEIFVLLLTILSIFYSIHSNIFADKTLHDNFLTYPINQIERNDENYIQKIKYDSEKGSKNIDSVVISKLDSIINSLKKVDHNSINIDSDIDSLIKIDSLLKHKCSINIDNVRNRLDSIRNNLTKTDSLLKCKNNGKRIVTKDKNNINIDRIINSLTEIVSLLKEVNFIFVIDRTLSGQNKKDSIYQQNKRILLTEINDSTLSANRDSIEISDILLCKMMQSLKMKNSNLPKKTLCYIIIYNGVKENSVKSQKIIPQKNIDPSQFYIKSINKKDNDGTYTNISHIFELIDKSAIINPKNHNVITIISDFEHERKTTNAHILESAIEQFMENKTDSIVLNLVCLSGSSRNDFFVMRQTRQLINKYSYFIYFYEYEQEHLTDKKSKELFPFITQMPQKDTKQSIILYYPLSFGKFQNANTSKIWFSNIEKTDTFLLNLKNESGLHETAHMKVEVKDSNKKLFKQFQLIDHPKLVTIDSSKIFSLILESQNKSDNLFLEISNPFNLTRQRIPIEFKEYLTDGICYILIILNTFLIILITFLMYFFYRKCRHCYRVNYYEGLKLGSNFILVLPILGVVLFALYAVKICYTLLLICWFFVLIWVLIIVLFVWFLSRFYCLEQELFNKKCNELHKKI